MVLGERQDPHRTPSGTTTRRLSKRRIRVIAWVAGAVGFVMPWAVFQAVPRPASAAPQVVVVPAGSRIVTKRAPAGGSTSVVVVPGKATTSSPPVTTTGGSVPPP